MHTRGTRGTAPPSCLSPFPGKCPFGRAGLGPPAKPSLLKVYNAGASMSPLGCASCFWVAQNPSGADGCGQGSGCSLCPPTCRRSWRWIGAKLQTGRGWVMEDLHFQQDRCLLSFLPSICSHALFWEVVNFKGKTKVTGGCQPSAVRGHCGTSGCSWFRTNGGNVWRRGFLPQGCLNLSGKVFSCRTTYSTL